MDILDDGQPMHSVEYLLKRAQESVHVTRKKEPVGIKEESMEVVMQNESQGSEVDWNRLTQTLQGIIFFNSF